MLADEAVSARQVFERAATLFPQGGR